MLERIYEANKGKTAYIILDNASYQKCKGVMGYAKGLGINLEFIPPYSPDLNLIERLGKYVKTELRSKYYENFDEFKATINSIINKTSTKNREIIDRLINEKVKLYDDLIPVDQYTLEVPHKPQNALV